MRGTKRTPLARYTSASLAVRGGNRLLWVLLPNADNYALPAEINWQVHVYGDAQADLRAWCSQHCIPLHVFGWQPAHHQAGLAQNAVYLLRPPKAEINILA